MYTVFNLTNTTYTQETSTFFLSANSTDPDKPFQWIFGDHLLLNLVNGAFDCNITMTLTSASTNLPFDLVNNKDPQVPSANPGPDD